MQIEQIAVAELTPYARNSRTHSVEQIAQVSASITEFGFTNPVLIDGSGGIIAGHGRVMAAKQLNLESVPCIRLGHLTEAQKRAYIIADNQIALNSGWNIDLLAAELESLRELDFDLELLSFSGKQLDDFFSDDLGQIPLPAEDAVGEKKTIITCPKCGFEHV